MASTPGSWGCNGAAMLVSLVLGLFGGECDLCGADVERRRRSNSKFRNWNMKPWWPLGVCFVMCRKLSHARLLCSFKEESEEAIVVSGGQFAPTPFLVIHPPAS